MSDVYLGNPLLKKANTPIEFTEDQILEFVRCKNDPVYFAKNYVKIVTLDKGLQSFAMYPFQEKLVNNFHKHNSYYNSKIFEETEKKLPEEIVIKSSNDLTLTNNKNINNSEEWRRSHGNAHSNRFSSLKNINWENINKLDVAWTYEFSERGWDIQSNIIFADGKVFIPSTKKHIVALNAYNGQELWKYETKQLVPARRGLIF